MSTSSASRAKLEDKARQLRSRVDAAPSDVTAWLSLGQTQLRLKSPQTVVKTLTEGVGHHPDSGTLAAALAQAHVACGDAAAAAEWYARAEGLAPDDVAVLRDAASFWEKRHDLERASALAAAILSLAPNDAMALVMRARTARRSGDAAHALAGLDAAEPEASDGAARAAYWVERGRCLDALGRFDDALASFAKGQSVNRETYPDVPALQAQAVSVVQHERKQLDALGSAPEIPVPHFGKAPVFLVGFPRSGTTLLDTILDAHSGITVLSERSPVEGLHSERMRLETQSSGETLDASRIEDMRRRYWHAIDDQLGVRPEGLLVDKLPLNLVSIRTIHTLFPSAKIVFALRHPCDVCLSNFTQPFALNMFMAHFLSLKETAAFYASCMTLWAQARAALPLTVHEVRYENVVEDFDATIRNLLAFLGVPWDDAVSAFDTHAASRAIVTPSYEQVSKPIYTASRGRWHNYRNAMEPVLPTLRPFIDAFGYSEAQDSAS